MERTGTLSIANGESRLDGVLLARCDETNPTGAATSFLQSRGLQSGVIQVTGEDGDINGVAVFCMDDAQRAAAAASLAVRRAAKKAAKKKAAKKKANKAAKQKPKSKKKGTSNSAKHKGNRRS